MSNSWKLGNMILNFGNLLKFLPLKLCVNGFCAKNYGFYVVMMWKLSIFHSTLKALFYDYYHYYYQDNYTWFCGSKSTYISLLYIIWMTMKNAVRNYWCIKFFTIWAHLKKSSHGISFATYRITHCYVDKVFTFKRNSWFL